ncbi:MAG: nickel pincer cofactor biosynthesis protein LarB [Deltaproteobacteria bacterium]|jgi:NCAIR mutase (PurE)-related protein|nr:nickel pincer cofactor biosynthesis protein LarB [Deltaproteobacteria bacterium]
MDPKKLRELLEQVGNGGLTIDDAMTGLRDLPFADLGYAMVDHHRALRQGVPEVILGEGKTADHIVGITEELARRDVNTLITRLDPAKAEAVRERLPAVRYHAVSRIATLEVRPIPTLGKSPVAVICAGTSDAPVAEEACETLRMLGASVERVYDVGVAGVHRLLARRAVFERCSVAIVVAGMEGALPSAVGGMVSIPVIAVPTSVGYGAALGGLAALASMLTSCASGVTVCNIDNGFGAAFAAARILQSASRY